MMVIKKSGCWLSHYPPKCKLNRIGAVQSFIGADLKVGWFGVDCGYRQDLWPERLSSHEHRGQSRCPATDSVKAPLGLILGSRGTQNRGKALILATKDMIPRAIFLRASCPRCFWYFLSIFDRFVRKDQRKKQYVVVFLPLFPIFEKPCILHATLTGGTVFANMLKS